MNPELCAYQASTLLSNSKSLDMIRIIYLALKMVLAEIKLFAQCPSISSNLDKRQAL